MSRSREELDRLSDQAWRELRGDITRSVRHAGQAGVAYAKKHPFIVVAAGGILAALAVSRVRRPAVAAVDRPHKVRRISGLARRLVRAGRLWLVRWLSTLAAPRVESESENPMESMPTNGHMSE